MTDKSYNMYIRMIKLACANVRNDICQENGMPDSDAVQVKIRDRDGLVDITAAIVHSPDSAEVIYASRVQKRIVILTDFKLLHSVDTASVFIRSILKSRSARICQKQVMNYGMAERYLDAAWDYDLQHPEKGGMLEYAKGVIVDKYSLNFLGGFTFGSRPHVESSILHSLKSQAFDPAYAFMTEEQSTKITERKYAQEFCTRSDVFVTQQLSGFGMDTMPDTHQKSMIDVFIQKSRKSETDIIAQLYNTSFADMPLQKRRRRFVNLKSRNRDIEICPERNLSVKRQFAQIEATTKHAYIMDYFDGNAGNESSRSRYYFSQELWMYQYIWQTSGAVYSRDGSIYFPDGRAIAIPSAMSDYEFFHKINTVYAALFGFTSDDAVGGSNWLIDSIRSAYTDEGNALYRLAVIDERTKHITSEREAIKKW